MKKKLGLLFIFSFLLGFIVAGCKAPALMPEVVKNAEKSVSSQEVPVKIASSWEKEWADALILAKKEGKVVVTSGLEPNVRQGLGEGFRKEFGIQVEWITARGAETAERVLRERRANVYSFDLYTSGSTTVLSRLKPADAVLPLEPLLILPEIKDPKYWFQGRLPWDDKDKTVFTFWLNAFPHITINTDLVKKEEINSYYDLLNPKWKRKIVMDDPTITGSANKWAITTGEFFPSLGWEFQRELARQEPILMRDRRLMTEWVARGKYPITLPISAFLIFEFKEGGAPLESITTREGLYGGSGNANLAYYNNAPHPSAAKVFINWLLGKRAQEIAATAGGSESTRLDVSTKHLPPGLRREDVIKATGTLINVGGDVFEDISKKAMPIVMEIWGPLVGR